MRMARLLAILFVLLSIYSVMGACPSCEISHIKSWTFSTNNGVGTARCCPKSEASAGVSLLWPNGTDIEPANYFHSSSNGCDEISISLSDQQCGVHVVCETSLGRSVLEKENASIEFKSCLSLFSSSESIDLLQACLNCSDNIHNVETTSTGTVIIIATSGVVSDTILSTAAPPVIADQQNNAHVEVIAVVAVLLLGIVLAVISTVFIIRHRNRKNAGQVQQENTVLLNNYGLRSTPDTPAIPPPTETVVGPVQPFAPPGNEPPDLDSNSPDNTENSRSSPPEQECSSQPDGEMASVVVVQASDRLFFPRSLSKDTDDVRYISENDTRRMNLSRSLSCPK